MVVRCFEVDDLGSRDNWQLQGLELYIRDSADSNVLVTNVTVVYQFLSQNDPPAIQAQIPAGGLQLIKNSSTALEIDISDWKIDADTPQNQLCFDVASYDSLMIFLLSSRIWASNSESDNCINDKLLLFPVLNAEGQLHSNYSCLIRLI